MTHTRKIVLLVVVALVVLLWLFFSWKKKGGVVKDGHLWVTVTPAEACQFYANWKAGGVHVPIYSNPNGVEIAYHDIGKNCARGTHTATFYRRVI